METIEIRIEDKILKSIGKKAIQERISKEIEYLYYEELASNIDKQLQNSDINNEKELEIARQKAWDETKQEFLKGINE